MEIWTLTIKNKTKKVLNLSIFGYALFPLDGCDNEGRYVGRDNYSEIIPELGAVVVTNRNRFAPTNRFKGFMMSLKNFHSADGYRDQFLRSEFAVGTPKILWGYNCGNQGWYGPDCAAAIQVKIKVKPNSEGRVDYIIGQAETLSEVKKIKKSLSEEKIDAMCLRQEEKERKRSASYIVRTGNKNYDGLINIFVKKQLYSYLINKSGFRDNLQVDAALAMSDIKDAEDNFLRALASQYTDGKVPHSFRPLNRLQYSDKPAWILMTAPALIKESGNLSLLEEIVPFFESSEKASVWEHMIRTMRYLSNDLGRHGFCRQHHADWNDGLEATKESGERESIMVTQQLCYGLLEMIELANLKGDSSIIKEASQIYEDFKNKLNKFAWDGKWYVRTICEDGYRIGSSENKEGKIFLNPQSWAILSKTAEGDRAQICMDSVKKYLECDIGFRICAPGFSNYDPRVGRMSNSMPGFAENGGCYNHAAGFKGVADCMLHRGDDAWRTFVKVAPDNPENPTSQSCGEPFSFTNMYALTKHCYGFAGYPWRTGTAAWFSMLLVEWILGARRSYSGLLIDPCLPKSMKTAEVTRTFRGAKYIIKIKNTGGKNKKVILDGSEFGEKVLPDFKKGSHNVVVEI